ALGRMGIRLAIGSGKCADYSGSGDPTVCEFCNRLKSRIEHLRRLPFETLLGLPAQATDIEAIATSRVAFTTFRDLGESGSDLVVVQGFLPSWRHARHFSSAGVGLMLAEGLVLHPDGVVDATDNLLWGYR